MEEHFVFPPDARAHDQSRRQKTALLQTEIRKAVKRSVVAGSSFDRFLRGSETDLGDRTEVRSGSHDDGPGETATVQPPGVTP